MIEFIPFEAAHLEALDLAEAKPYLDALIATPGYGDALAASGLALTARIGGRIAGAAGVMPQWRGVAVGWALFAALPPTAWTAITRRGRRLVAEAHRCGYRRVEANVDPGFHAAVRWAWMLGFRPEFLRQRYSPEGRDMLLFVRFG